MKPRPWHTGEIRVIHAYASLGAQGIATLLDRTAASVEHKARDLKVSLEITGEDIDISRETTKILQRIAEAPTLGICPLCGIRLATMKATGVCRACHLDQLIALREAQLVEIARERKLTKLRQDKKRLRICTKCGRPFFPRPSSPAIYCEDCE